MKEKILNEIVNNCMKLMNCITIQENYGEFKKAFNIIREELDDYYIRDFKVDNHSNLIISNTLDNNLDLIFCTHIDVVPCDEYKAVIKENKIFGRGSFDMKSQLSVIISLLKNNKSNKKVAFIITSDEEIGGKCCKEILKNYNSSLAVIPDAGRDFKLIVEEKGLFQLEITSFGISAHASEPFNGKNAILKSMNIYNELIKVYNPPKTLKDFVTSITLSKLIGGKSMNTVADISTMYLDVRFNKDFNKNAFINLIKKIDPDCIIKIVDYGPMFHVNQNNNLIQKFIKSFEKIFGNALEIDRCLATSDAIYFSEKNIPTILINPKGNYWHNPGEYVEIDSLYDLYLLFKTLL